MDHDYIELQEWDAELDELLGPVTQMKDTVTHQTFSVGQSTDMLLEEIEDFDIYETRMNMVNGDLLKYFDNPSLPSNLERMTMLDRLGETLWYEKWIHERAAQFAELEDLDMGTIDLGITNQAQSLAKERVTDIFEGLEMAEIPKKDSLDALHEWAQENDAMIDAHEAAEYNEIYDVPQMSIGRSSSVAAMEDAGIEMVELVEQTVNLSETVRELQLVNDAHVFFGIDETTARFSQTALDAFEGVATTGPVGYGWDLWPTVEEMVGLGQSIATGAAGALVMYGLVEGLTPIIKSLGDTDWIRGGYSVETKESVSMTDSITSSMLGPMYKISQRIAKHLEDHPTYVWFLDNFNARVSKKKETHYIIWDFIRDPPCSTFWLRGRVIAMEGKKVGYSDSPSQLMLGVKLTLTKTDMAPNNQTFWVNAETAVVLRDGAAVQHACNTKNLANMIFNSWDKYPLLNPVDPPPPPQKHRRRRPPKRPKRKKNIRGRSGVQFKGPHFQQCRVHQKNESGHLQ
jgi:hypothetical protein